MEGDFDNIGEDNNNWGDDFLKCYAEAVFHSAILELLIYFFLIFICGYGVMNGVNRVYSVNQKHQQAVDNVQDEEFRHSLHKATLDLNGDPCARSTYHAHTLYGPVRERLADAWDNLHIIDTIANLLNRGPWLIFFIAMLAGLNLTVFGPSAICLRLSLENRYNTFKQEIWYIFHFMLFVYTIICAYLFDRFKSNYFVRKNKRKKK